ncbi:uncharacterized protein LOC113213963 [Frankliniella occidentalis]|uniref:Uncharacterized protein LOC113213963 n=1 Tax=Frankliniella occidentalis TaxID=133901 RepID=A0A6J1T5V2_FRAOC|nr:uncharacterized protein LOC113213963 [Frankliniella occidentalis]
MKFCGLAFVVLAAVVLEVQGLIDAPEQKELLAPEETALINPFGIARCLINIPLSALRGVWYSFMSCTEEVPWPYYFPCVGATLVESVGVTILETIYCFGQQPA